MTKFSEARLQLVHPSLAALVRSLASSLAEEGIDLEVVQGLRSWSEQQDLYNQGRTTPGNIVTKCPPGWSWHNFGLAVDVAPFEDGKPNWNDFHPSWSRIHEVSKSMGFTCGADFVHFPDKPHLQLTGRFPVNPSDEVRQLFKDGGVQAVWQESGL